MSEEFYQKNEAKHHSINVQAVLSELTSGGGYTQLKKTLSYMGLPIMTNKIYVETRNQIDEVVWILNEEAM